LPLRPHDFSTHRAVFNQAFATGSFRGSFLGGGHAAASAFLRHVNSSGMRFVCLGCRYYSIGRRSVLYGVTHNGNIPVVVGCRQTGRQAVQQLQQPETVACVRQRTVSPSLSMYK